MLKIIDDLRTKEFFKTKLLLIFHSKYLVGSLFHSFLHWPMFKWQWHYQSQMHFWDQCRLVDAFVRGKGLFAQNFAYMYWTWRQNSTWFSNVNLIIFLDDDRKEKVDAMLDETKSVNSKPTLQVNCNYFQRLS